MMDLLPILSSILDIISSIPSKVSLEIVAYVFPLSVPPIDFNFELILTSSLEYGSIIFGRPHCCTYNYDRHLKYCKNNREENEFSAFPRNEKVTPKKEYSNNITVKQNQASQSLTVNQIQVITLIPLKLLNHFLITMLMLATEGEN